MSDCLFCKILAGEIPSEKIFENEKVYAFRDISPMAKEHYLFINKVHTANANDMVTNHPEQFVEIYQAIQEFTQNNQLEQNGFRVVTNVGKDSGQTVFHTHFHVLGGERLRGFGS